MMIEDAMPISRKNRVTVACNRCRRGKRRCDGRIRCQNCIASNAECQYEKQERKPSQKIKKSQKQDKVMNYMTARLDRLETIMLKLVEKMCDSDKESFSSISKMTGNAVTELNFESEDDQSTTSESTNYQKDPGTSSNEKPQLEPLIKYGELYLGSHSFFSILSKSSLAWMSEQLGEDALHLIVPFTNLPAMFQKITKSLFKKWLGSPNLTHAEKFRILRNPFTQSKEFLTDLFAKHAPSFSCASIFFTQESMLKFLDRYFDTSVERNFDINLLFRATTVVLFCLSKAIDMKLSDTETSLDPDSSTEGDYSIKNLTTLRDELLSNCFYYTHQLSLLGSSVQCLQAFLFFAIYMDNHVHAPEIIYLILVQAASKAKDLGLHRIETYNNFDDPATKLRLSLWFLVSYVDMEICFRTGKTPLINYQDVSPEIMQHYHISSIAPEGSSTVEFHKWHSYMFDIRLESYNRLFSATANVHSFEVLSSNLDFINLEMSNLASIMSGDRRPLFFHDPGFTQIYSIENDSDELRARSLLSFFAHTMLINRIPSMHNFPDMFSGKCSVYRSLSLNSARTILYLLKDFDYQNQGPFPLWMFYLPVSAILHISAACISDPGSQEAESDIRLIAETCKKHFNRINSHTRTISTEAEISILLEILVKSMLKVVIKMYDTRTGKSFLREDTAFKDTLHMVRKYFPRLFQAQKDLESQLGCHFQGKSPFPGGNKGSSLTGSPSTASDRSFASRTSNNGMPDFNTNNDLMDPMDPMDPAKFLAQFDEVDFFLQSQIEPNPNFFTNTSVL